MGVPISKLPRTTAPLIGDIIPFSTPDPSSDTGYSTFGASFQQVQQFIGVGPTGPQGAPGATGATGATGPQGPAGIPNFLIFDTLAQFLAASSMAGVTEVYVQAVTGTFPPAAGLEATGLRYKAVGSPTGLYGEVTVAGVIFDPVYSTNPVNMGQFGVVGDAHYAEAGITLTATANGTNVLTTASTAGLVNGMNIEIGRAHV